MASTSARTGAIQPEESRPRPMRAGDFACDFGKAAVVDPAVLVTRPRHDNLVCFPPPLAKDVGPELDSGLKEEFGGRSRLFQTSGYPAGLRARRKLETSIGTFLHSVNQEGNHTLLPDTGWCGPAVKLLPQIEQLLPGQIV
jgi:hypothetical protein